MDKTNIYVLVQTIKRSLRSILHFFYLSDRELRPSFDFTIVFIRYDESVANTIAK